MRTLNKKNVSFDLNQINGYLTRGLHLERFDPSQRLIDPRIWIYSSIGAFTLFWSKYVIYIRGCYHSYKLMEMERYIDVNVPLIYVQNKNKKQTACYKFQERGACYKF